MSGVTALRSPQARQRGLRVLLDLVLVALVVATVAELVDPEILIDGLWVTLAVSAFVLSLRAVLFRIAIVTAFITGFIWTTSRTPGGAVDMEDLATVPLLLIIVLIVAVMAHRASTTARRYATLYRQTSERLVTTQEEERSRLSRDLHDSLGQTLTAAILTLDAADAELPRAPDGHGAASRASATIHKAQALVATALDQARQVALQLRPPRIEEVGLGASIAGLAGSAGIPVEVRFPPGSLPPGLLDPEQEIGLFRIVQEALANAARHSHATYAWVDAEVTHDRVRLTIGDDGIGFEPGATRRGLGLAGMEERAAILRGRIEISSRPLGGTIVDVTVPAPTRALPPGIPAPGAAPEGAR